MQDKKILTLPDISCVGQCSLTVALPIISACGLETCILPSAVLSTHTGGFSGYTVRDLTDDIPAIAAHWQKENLSFDTIYTGYLGSTRQIDMVIDIMEHLLTPQGLRIVDPAMADHGKLYYGFDMEFVAAMAKLCGTADIVLPNLTEACMMTGTEYIPEGYDEAYILGLMQKLCALGAKTIVFTGVNYGEDKYGVAVYSAGDEKPQYYFHRHLARQSHGTGDVYASAFTGALTQGCSVLEAAQIAADFTVESIEKTSESHWYGVNFERALPLLVDRLNKE